MVEAASVPVNKTAFRVHSEQSYNNECERLKSHGGRFLEWNDDTHPTERCKVEVVPGVTVLVYAQNDRVLIVGNGDREPVWQQQIVDVEPYATVEVMGDAKHRMVEKRKHWNYPSRGLEMVPDCYKDEYPYHYGGRREHYDGKTKWPWLYLDLRVTVTRGDVTETHDVPWVGFHNPLETGTTDIRPEALGFQNRIIVTGEFFGLKWDDEIKWDDYRKLWRLTKGTVQPSIYDFWIAFFKRHAHPSDAGLKATVKKKDIAPNLDRMKEEKSLLWIFWECLQSGKTHDGVKNNQLLSTFLKLHGADYDELTDHLGKAMASLIDSPPGERYYSSDYMKTKMREACLLLPGASDLKASKTKKKVWSEAKGLMDKSGILGIDPKRHPKLHKAISEKKVPLSVFHEPDSKEHLINVEFDLWEKALSQKGWSEILFAIAQDAARRSTYTKNVTSYMAFLFKIPVYLDRHTPGRQKWRAMPKFVANASELEMKEESDGGTVKTRSALTPIVDNEERTITVPYAAVQISGFGTAYCYSDRYVVFEQFMNDPEGEGVVQHELEEKLNGKDDYGLMYYTLTGTHTARGYPTFLIIFERLHSRNETRVHFHRVHPNRQKKGIKTPTARLISECYRYMAGNIRAEEISAQQGDLIFIPAESPGKKISDPRVVQSFESHAFLGEHGAAVQLRESTAKTKGNVLGWITCGENIDVTHPEHEDLYLAEGTYKVVRCKSWEASPNSVWVGTID